MAAPQRCRHECPCGAVLICGDADKCGAGAFWRCFACELDHFDDYVSRRYDELNHAHASQLAHEHDKEHAHEGQ